MKKKDIFTNRKKVVFSLSLQGESSQVLCLNSFKLKHGIDPLYSDLLKTLHATRQAVVDQGTIDEIINSSYAQLKSKLHPEKNWIHFLTEKNGEYFFVDYNWFGNKKYEKHVHPLSDHTKTHGRKGAIILTFGHSTLSS